VIKKYTAGLATELAIIELIPASMQGQVLDALLRERLQVPGSMTEAREETRSKLCPPARDQLPGDERGG
jgi:hypothetical protein